MLIGATCIRSTSQCIQDNHNVTDLLPQLLIRWDEGKSLQGILPICHCTLKANAVRLVWLGLGEKIQTGVLDTCTGVSERVI